MNLTKRILSTLLAVLTVLGSLTVIVTIPASAADTKNEATKDIDIYDYSTTLYKTPEEKLATMQWMYTDASGRYQLYADEKSGEVACKDVISGNILFTNPYDVATLKSDDVKYEIMSQIIITYSDNSGMIKTLNSFKDAALNEQIKVQQIKKGVRVEYTIGREDTKKLVPRWILADEFEEKILQPMQDAVERGEITQFQYDQFKNRWQKQDMNPDVGNFRETIWFEKYPFLKDMGVAGEGDKKVYPVFYTFRDNINAADIQKTEDTIKKYTDYTFEDMDAMHELTGYVSTDELYPAFKLALEYYADEDGMSVRLPCNGLRYDMANFRLENICMLPFIGAGNYKQDGYAFFPDGSGALFDYETMRGTSVTVSGAVYGEDYAYHDLLEMKYERVVRYPVYGAVSTEKIYEYTYSKDGKVFTEKVSATIKTEAQIRQELDAMGAILDESKSNFSNPTEYQRGYLAILEEADSLATIKLEAGGVRHNYATLRTYVNPKPKDTYVFSGNSSMTVVSDRKYTGSISLRFVMLCDENVASNTRQTNPSYTAYDTTWVGMAKAYREYLEKTGVLARLTAEQICNDIPLYIESFGALETQETVATLPVYLMTPLTTFDNVLQMYNDLSDAGVKNINFKLTGFANGGMYYTVPSSLKWESKVGGKKGFTALIEEASKINDREDGSHLGLYPDFDFAYIQTNGLFDSVVLKKDAVQTIDGRYTSYRQYSPTQQTFLTFYQLAISPSRYSKFYDKLLSKYEQYGLNTLSVASLGNTLNSDFDEEEPYNREESKEFTIQALSYIQSKGYSIMTDSGNAYTWKYVDHILNVDLDSSRYLESSASVPFIGTVLHGYVQFAGTPLNEEGDANYAMLRAIENGASLYFLLSYQNTSELKNDSVLSQYYSIRYDIWKTDVAKYYNELNSVLSDVQLKQIINHEFLKGERILDLDELRNEIADQLEAAEREEADKNKNEQIGELNSVADAWALLYGAENTAKGILNDIRQLNVSIAQALSDCHAIHTLGVSNTAFVNAETALNEAKDNLNNAKTALDAANEQLKAAQAALEAADDAGKATAQAAVDAAQAAVDGAQAEYDAKNAALEAAQKAYDNALAEVSAKVQNAYEALLDLVDYTIKLSALKAEADTLAALMPQAIEIVENTNIYEDDIQMQNKLLAQMATYKANAEVYLPRINAEYAVYADTLVLEDAGVFAETVNAFKTATENETNKTLCDVFSAYSFDMDELTEMYESKLRGDNVGGGTVVQTPAGNSNVIDNKRIVAVTYGTGEEAYKTFILNYNSFSVRVVYNGTVYTIASGDYIVVEYSNANA